MKFDFVIGNPPYQERSDGEKISDDSLYWFFMDAAYEVSDRVELITPARFLFENGNTPKKWNQKMLNDEHFKVLDYQSDGKKVFSGTDIKGGVAIHYRDSSKDYGAIEHFTAYPELNSILKKVMASDCESLTSIMYNQNKFNLEMLYKDYPHLKNVISSEGREKRITSGSVGYECFKEVPEREDDYKLIGVINNKRVFRYVDKKYIEECHENITKYKVITSANFGSGAIGDALSNPIVGDPNMCFTQTFISVGAFDEKQEAENALKYLKTKFCRVMISVLKVTQNGKRDMWRFVPLQEFSTSSDIDWSVSIANIDKQLYKKYGLSQEEIKFIENNAKEMA